MHEVGSFSHFCSPIGGRPKPKSLLYRSLPLSHTRLSESSLFSGAAAAAAASLIPAAAQE